MSPEPPSAPARASLLVLGMAAFLVSADARVIDPLLKVIAHEFQVTNQSAALTVSAYALPYGLFQLFYGPLGDRVGKLKVMAAVLLLFSLGTAACALVPNLPVFIALRLLTGAVAAAVIPLSLSYIGDKFPYESRQSALGRFMSALMLGQVLSATIGGVFGEHLGWRGIFLVFGALGLVTSALLAREARRFAEDHKDRRFSFAPIVDLWKLPMARLIFGSVFLEGFYVFGGLAYLAASALERYRFLHTDQVGLMLAGFGLGGLVYSVSVKRLVPRIGERGILLLGGSLLCLGYTLIGLLPAWWLFPVGVVVFGMGYYTMHGTLQTRATELSQSARATAVALFAFTFFLGQGIGPAAMGQLVKARGYEIGFVGAGVGLLLLALWVRMRITRITMGESAR